MNLECNNDQHKEHKARTAGDGVSTCTLSLWGDQDGIPGFWLRPDPDLVVVALWGRTSRWKSLLLPTPSSFQINKPSKQQAKWKPEHQGGGPPHSAFSTCGSTIKLHLLSHHNLWMPSAQACRCWCACAIPYGFDVVGPSKFPGLEVWLILGRTALRPWTLMVQVHSRHVRQ